MSQSRVAVITFLDGGPDLGVGYPLPTPPVYLSHGLPPSPGYPTGGPVLPPGGVTLPVFPFDPTDPGYGQGGGFRPDNSLPGSGGRPDNSLPGSGNRPSNELPSPGRRYIVKWLACTGLILVPDNSLPGQGGSIDNELPETGQPK